MKLPQGDNDKQYSTDGWVVFSPVVEVLLLPVAVHRDAHAAMKNRVVVISVVKFERMGVDDKRLLV